MELFSASKCFVLVKCHFLHNRNDVILVVEGQRADIEARLAKISPSLEQLLV